MAGTSPGLVLGEQWETHTYRFTGDAPSVSVDAAEIERRHQQVSMACAIGLSGADGRALFPELAATLYPAMSEDQEYIWSSHGLDVQRQLSAAWPNYPYSTPPANVLSALDGAVRDWVFDDHQLWSLRLPQGGFRQFLATGIVVEEHTGRPVRVHYLIARWGRPLLSDEHLTHTAKAIRGGT